MQPRTRNERKQQLPAYLNEEQLLQELQHQAKQKQKQKQYEELQEQEELLKHMQNYQLGGEENKELEDFLQKKIMDLKKENDKFGNENYQNYTLQQSPQQEPINYDQFAIKQQQPWQGNQQKTQSEIEREKRLKLRQEERQRRLLGIQASVYDSSNSNQTPQEQISYPQQQNQIPFQQQHQQNQQQYNQQKQQSPVQIKQNIKQNSSNITSILHGSYEPQQQIKQPATKNQDILSNYIPKESDKQQQQYQQKLPPTPSISTKDKQLKYKQELDQQIAQKRNRIQSAHPYYNQQQDQVPASTPSARIGSVLPQQQVQDESLKKIQELEKKRKYADELKKQMQEKNSININNNPKQIATPQIQQQNNQINYPNSLKENPILYQDQGLRENNQNFSNGAAQINYPQSNQENDPEKQKALQQEKKRQYRDALLQQMQEQQSQKQETKKRNITSARIQSQNSFPLQIQNEDDFSQQQQFQQFQQVQLIDNNNNNQNPKLCKKITKQFEDEDQLREKQIKQQQYQEILRKQIAEQNEKKEQEKQKLKQEEEKAEMQLEIQRQQMKEQLLQQKDEGNQKVSRRKRVNNTCINQHLETSEQIVLKEQIKKQNQYEESNEFTKQSNYFSQPSQQQQQQLEIDVQTQNYSQNQFPEQKTPKYIQPTTQNISDFVPSTQQQFNQQQGNPIMQLNQQPQMMEQQFIPGQYQNQFQQFQQQQIPPQFYQNQQQYQYQQFPPYQNFPMYQQPQITQQQFMSNQPQDQMNQLTNQLVQQQVNTELQMQKEAMNNLQNQMQQLVDMYKNQITDLMGQKGTTDQQIVYLKQMMEEKFSNPYNFSQMNSMLAANPSQYSQIQQQQQQQQQQSQLFYQQQQQQQKKYWQKKQDAQANLQFQQQQQQQYLQIPNETMIKENHSQILQQSLLPFDTDYVQPEGNIMEQSYQKDLLLFEKLNKNKESFAKQFEELQQKEQQLTKQINENEELLRKSQCEKKQSEQQNESVQIPKDIDQKLSKVVNADYSYFDQKRKLKQDEKQFDQLKEALLSEESEEEIDQSFEAANISEIKKQENEVKLGVAQFANDQNSLVLQEEEAPDQSNIQKFIESQVNEVQEVNEVNDDDEIDSINNKSELNLKELDKKLIEEFNQVRKSGKPLLDEELKQKVESLSVHASAEKDKSYQQQQNPFQEKKAYGKPKTFDIFGQIEKQNSHILTKNKEKQEQILTRLDKFIEEALEEVGNDYQDEENNYYEDESENQREEDEAIDTQQLYEEVQKIEERNKLSFKEARKSFSSQRYQDEDFN